MRAGTLAHHSLTERFREHSRDSVRVRGVCNDYWYYKQLARLTLLEHVKELASHHRHIAAWQAVVAAAAAICGAARIGQHWYYNKAHAATQQLGVCVRGNTDAAHGYVHPRGHSSAVSAAGASMCGQVVMGLSLPMGCGPANSATRASGSVEILVPQAPWKHVCIILGTAAISRLMASPAIHTEAPPPQQHPPFSHPPLLQPAGRGISPHPAQRQRSRMRTQTPKLSGQR